MTSISRRTFMAGLASSILPACATGTPAIGPGNKVIVVGAGLAGLAAAYDLRQFGIDVTVLEQSSRVGGRIKTLRGHFDNDAWVDIGGQTAGVGYGNFIYYADRFGLAFEQTEATADQRRPDILLHLQNQLYSAAALRAGSRDWPLALTEEEKALAPSRLLNHYIGPIAGEIQTVDRVLNPEFIDYDKLSLRQLLEQRGASEAAVRMIDHTLNYNSVDTVSALSALRDAVRALLQRRGPRGSAKNLANGNGRLPDAFAKQLGAAIRLNSTVKAVSQNEHSVRVQLKNNGLTENLQADRVVLAIPFTALRRLQFDPGLPAGRQQIIDELPYTQIVQAWLQTKTRFWEKDGPVAMVVSDGPLERLFNASRKMSGERGLLVNWVNGTGTAIAAHGPEQHLLNVINTIDSVWPGSAELIEQTYTHSWNDSYAKGAYAHYAPGQMARFAKEIPRPVDRLHFAGEHTELVAPGMEGALTSGKRAAAEILLAAG